MKKFLIFLFLLVSTLGWSQRPFFRERWRPELHFTPQANWMNDPNGLVYYGGKYHLFYQYYPGAMVWGPMHWGHAVSKDLLHWEHLPIALYPDSLGYIFSGSVVVDEQNTSGLQKGKEKTLVAIYTYHNPVGEKQGKIDFQTQGMAYSNDGGTTWKKYKANPVLKNPGIKDFRDPKVSWYAPEKKWVMTLAAGNRVQFYSSRNLKEWTYLSSFGEKDGAHGGVWECPDLVRMQDAETGREKWVLLVSIGSGGPNGGSATQYFTGQFDGKQFTNEEVAEVVKWVDQGTDNYAGVTFFNAPGNHPIFIGWMSNWEYAQQVPTKNWRSAMTIPRQLKIKTIDGHSRLLSQPIPTIERMLTKTQLMDLQRENYTVDHYALDINVRLSDYPQKDTLLLAEWFNDMGDTLQLRYLINQAVIEVDRTRAGVKDFHPNFGRIIRGKRINNGNELNIHLIMDRSSLELFADEGSLVMSVLVFPNSSYRGRQIK
ncbi:MAG: glycoside hydrolase family 32 protein [Bacteroidota bacterium]